jgi:hypothetical protein
MMMRSAVQLIDKLALASVWVPSFIKNPESKSPELSNQVEILAVFSKTEGTALENIYAVGVQKELPFLGKWMQKESLDGGSRRKVFMVPTPLHIPDSETSPIAQSLHHVLLFKDLASSGKLRLVPASKILWKHPLVYVQKRRG